MTAEQLKNSILQMAVSGKLGPQDPNDEPASVLLERIRKEKEQLIKEGKIKKEKNPSYIFRGADNTPYEKVGNNDPVSIADDVPFEIPDSWEWARLGMISTYAQTKKKINAQNADPNVWGLDLEDIEKGGRLLSKITVGERKAIGDKTCFNKGDILYSKLRPYLLKVLIAEDDGICTPEIVPFKVYGNTYTEYIVAYLKSPYVDGVINAATYGVKMPRTGTETMTNLLVPIPPLNEQYRIVSKIKELSPSVSKYKEKEQLMTALNETFPEQLRKSILQLAIQGKLVPQDPNDEPASVLLERIRAEKERLIKEGKIKRDKNESVIYRRDNSHYEKRGKMEVCIDEEIPFEIPDSWVWVRLGNVLREIIVPMRDKPPFSGCIPWCRIEDRDGYYLNGTKSNQYVSDETIKKMNLKVNPVGTVLSASSGASIGTIAINTVECCTNQTFNGLVCSSGLYNWYLFWFLNSIIHSLKQLGTGTTLAYISQEKYKRMLFPLPPLNEQHRIVKRISELEQNLLSLKNTGRP